MNEVNEVKMNEAGCINKVNLQSLHRSVNRLVFGVNRSALVRPAKTLTDPRVLGLTESYRYSGRIRMAEDGDSRSYKYNGTEGLE